MGQIIDPLHIRKHNGKTKQSPGEKKFNYVTRLTWHPIKAKTHYPKDRLQRVFTWQSKSRHYDVIVYATLLSHFSSTATLLPHPKSDGFLKDNFGNLMSVKTLKIFQLMLSFSLNKYHCRSYAIQNHSTGLRMSSEYSNRSLKYKHIATKVKYAHKTIFKRQNPPNTFPLPLPLNTFNWSIHILLCARHQFLSIQIQH